MSRESKSLDTDCRLVVAELEIQVDNEKKLLNDTGFSFRVMKIFWNQIV